MYRPLGVFLCALDGLPPLPQPALLTYVGVIGPLRFVEDQHVLGRHEPGLARVRPDVVLHATDERLASTTR